MIYTLNILSEMTRRRLSGGDIPNDSPYLPAQVIAELINAIREDLKLEMLGRRAGGEDDRTTITQYIATFFDIEVKEEKSTGRVYIDLPSSYSSLKHNKGIHAVSDMRTPNHRMIPVHNPGVTSHLPNVDLEQSNFGYYTEGQRIYWMRNILNEKIKKILLKLLVPAPDTLGNNDPLPLLPENVGRIIDVVVNRILNRMPQDRLNDNNPNIRPNNV